MFKKILSNPFIFFPLATIIVLWPLAGCFFTVKNDALTYYYPVRALISDALNNGELPLWTPFINFGYPLHADMQSGGWNPVVWVFSYISKFSLAGFHAELLFYFSMAGISFYYLCRQYAYSVTTALIFGLVYELSGFMIDSVQFYACISSACWLPFIFLFYKKMITGRKTIDAILTGFFLYLLFTGGYPSLFIVTAYLLAAHFIFTFFTNTEKKVFIKNSLLPLAIMMIAFILFSLPAIISFAQYLPYIDRGKTQPLSFVLENSMPPAAMLSFISPFATTASNALLNTDALMRNTYIGFIPLLFVMYGIVNRQVKIKAEVRFFLVAAIVMSLMSWGSYFFFRQAAYYALPLMNTFRHPAILRLFGIFFLLLFGAYSFNQWQIKNSEAEKKGIKKMFFILAAAIGLFSIFLVIKNIGQIKELLQLVKLQSLKPLLQSLSFTQRYFIQFPFIAIILSVIFFAIKNRKALYLLRVVMLLDIFIMSQFNIPVTVIGATRFKEVEETINRNKIAFPIPSVTTSINENTGDSYSETTGSKLHYTKKIGRNDYYITPGNLTSQETFYESSLKEKVFEKSVLFFEGDSIGSITIHSFGANEMQLAVVCSRPATLVYLQNNYPGWQVFVDGEKSVVDTTMLTFISVQVPAGKHEVKFQYKPSAVYLAWYVSLAALLLFVILLFKSILFKNNQ